MRVREVALAILGTVLLGGCGGSPPEGVAPVPERTDSRLMVYVVNYPLAYFAERIGGDRVLVELPAPAGIDPADWSPDPETVAAYQGADLILLNGGGYARWVQRATLPASKLVDTSAAFRERIIELDEAARHSHGPEGEHSHGEAASTLWLDPSLAVEQARAVLQAFVAARPGDEAAFRGGFAALSEELQSLDRELEEVTGPLRSLPVLFSHPVYQYLERRYALNARSLHWEPDEIPDERHWRELRALLPDHPARWMIWEREPRQEFLQRLRSLGIESIVFDPCGTAPEKGDLLSVLRAGLRSLRNIQGT